VLSCRRSSSPDYISSSPPLLPFSRATRQIGSTDHSDAADWQLLPLDGITDRCIRPYKCSVELVRALITLTGFKP
jgi:hypothetical protein